MPRGSLPGERRGGRKPGTPNKKTLLKNAVFLAAAGEHNRSPLEFMLALMRDSQVPLDLRIEMAATAAPFVHTRPARNQRPDPLGGQNGLGDNGDLKFEKLEPKPLADGSAGEASGKGGGENGGLSPLDFLLGLMADPTATPRQRVKAAGVAARYKHAYAYAGGTEAPTVLVVGDKFGFKVDPEVARAERDDRLREAMLGATSHKHKKGSQEEKLAEEELKQIRKRRAERVGRLSFPDGYAYADLQDDQSRLAQLSSKRTSRKKLTPEEDAEEAHLAVRVLSPVPVPKSLQPAPEMEWPMSRITELEERRAGGETLSAAEDDELRDLRGRYPEIAAKVDRLDHRYRYCVRQASEEAENSDEYEAARAKCQPLRDPRKIATVEELRNGPFQRIYWLEVDRFDETLTPEEADELEELHRWYPERAEKTRKLVTRRLAEDRERRRLGFTSGPLEGWPRMKKSTFR
jgi:hypothetical protein